MAALKLMTIGLLLFSHTFAEDSSVERNLKEFGVVPDVIDTAPDGLLQFHLKVELGSELTPTQVKTSPALDWDADKGELYTVLLTDPDAPAKLREFRHWLVVNIPGNKLSEGKTIVDYIGSGAPKGTGFHRYVFLLFKQPKLIETNTFIPNNTREGRVKTKARDLIEEYNMTIMSQIFMLNWVVLQIKVEKKVCEQRSKKLSKSQCIIELKHVRDGIRNDLVANLTL